MFKELKDFPDLTKHRCGVGQDRRRDEDIWDLTEKAKASSSPVSQLNSAKHEVIYINI